MADDVTLFTILIWRAVSRHRINASPFLYPAAVLGLLGTRNNFILIRY